MNKNKSLSIRSLIITAVLCLATTVRASVPPAEKVLPDDTMAMITVPDTAKLHEFSKQSPMGQLWNDPAMKPFKEKFFSQLNDELIAPLERELGVKLSDYAGLAQGQLTLALTQNGWQGGKGEEAGVVCLLDARNKQDDLKKALADFRKKWTDAGKTVRVEKVRDVEFLVLTLTTNEIPKALAKLLPGASDVREAGDGKAAKDEIAAAKKSQLVIGQVESLLIVGNTVKVVERIVGQLMGSSAPVLADVAHFQSSQSAFFREAQAFGWVNAKVLVDTLARISDQIEKQAAEAPAPSATIRPEKMLAAAGLTGLRSVAVAYQDSPEGPLVQFHLGVPEAERKGLLKILAGDPKETTPPPFVPADVVKFTRWRMDGQKTWATLTSSLNDISPMIMSTVDFIINTADAAGKMKDEKFDFKRLVIGNLGDDLISYEKKPRSTDVAQLGNPPNLLLLGSKNAEEMATAVKVAFGLLAQDSKAPTEREFLGRKIYTLTTMTGPQLDPTNPKYRPTLLSSSGGYILISNDESVLEEYLRAGESPARPLRETSGLMDAAQKVTGPGTSLFGYENQLESERTAFELMKKAMAADTNAPVSGMTPVSESFGMTLPQVALKDWFDFSLLPPFDTVAKYFHFTVYGGSATVDGLTLKVFSPVPPRLKKEGR